MKPTRKVSRNSFLAEITGRTPSGLVQMPTDVDQGAPAEGKPGQKQPASDADG